MPNIQKSIRAVMAFILVVVVAAGTGAEAADIRVVSTEDCSILLDGDIVAGDADKLAIAIGRTSANTMPRSTLCMNSRGGNLAEGIAIADLIGVHRLATVVPSGAECLSACALAFMFGRVSAEEGGAVADRRLYYSARLGFHRPAVVLPAEAQYSAEQTAGYFNTAFEAMLQFFEISQQRATDDGPAFPWSLFSEMLAYQGPGAMFFIDTAYKAILWDIRVYGFDQTTALSDTGFARACATAEHIVLRGAEPFRDLRLEPGITAQVDGVVVEGDDWRMSSGRGWLGESGWPCEIWHVDFGGASRSAGSGLHRLCFGDARMRSGECFDHSLLGFPPDTRLADLPAVSRRVDAEGRAFLTSRRPAPAATGPSSCRLASPSVTVINVNSYATLRRAPGFDQDIVYEAQRGSDLRVLDPDGARLLGSDQQVYECNNLCEVSRRIDSTTELGRARMTQCFDENVFWYEVVAPNGARGWISGKYIE